MARGENPGDNPLGLPWRTKDRQEQGRREEVKSLKRMGVRAHPGSGSGKIQFDGSDEERIIEHKLAGKSFTMNGSYVAKLFRVATQQGKTAVMEIYFDEHDLTCEVTIRKGKPR